MLNRSRVRVLSVLLIVGLAGAAVHFSLAVAADAEARPAASADKLSWIVPNLQLINVEGQPCALDDWKQQRVLVLVQMTTHCPIGNRYVPILKELQAQLKDRGVQIALVYGSGQSLEQVKQHLSEFQIDLPAVIDEHNSVAELTGATRTAEAVVLDSRRAIRYRGRIDDRIGYQHQRDEPSRHDLREAINELLDHKEVSVKETQVAGCLLNRPASALSGQLTLYTDVAPIVQNKCQSCHRETGAAPFPLANAEDALNWAATIKQVVLERACPPGTPIPARQVRQRSQSDRCRAADARPLGRFRYPARRIVQGPGPKNSPITGQSANRILSLKCPRRSRSRPLA